MPPDIHFQNITPTEKFTKECLGKIQEDMLKEGFLWPEEQQLLLYILGKNEAAIAFENIHRETLKYFYFSSYKIPHVPHEP